MNYSRFIFILLAVAASSQAMMRRAARPPMSRPAVTARPAPVRRPAVPVRSFKTAQENLFWNACYIKALQEEYDSIIIAHGRAGILENHQKEVLVNFRPKRGASDDEIMHLAVETHHDSLFTRSFCGGSATAECIIPHDPAEEARIVDIHDNSGGFYSPLNTDLILHRIGKEFLSRKRWTALILPKYLDRIATGRSNWKRDSYALKLLKNSRKAFDPANPFVDSYRLRFFKD